MSLDAEISRREDGRLREAFAALAEDAVPSAECPPAERLWEAARGEAAPDAAREMIDHMAGCATCAEAWRLAGELDPGDGSSEAPAITPHHQVAVRRWGFGRAGLLAAAALLALVIGWQGLDLLAPAPDTTFRSAVASDEVRAVGSAELSRRDFVLRWQGPAGARYDLRVMTEDLVTVLEEARDLEVAEYRVPEEALANLAPGSKLFWHVAASVDGERVDDGTFETRID